MKISYNGKNYWKGPYGCLVPWSFGTCVAQDGRNIKYKDGSETELFIPNPPSKDQWLKIHTSYDGTKYIYQDETVQTIRRSQCIII